MPSWEEMVLMLERRLAAVEAILKIAPESKEIIDKTAVAARIGKKTGEPVQMGDKT